MLLFDCHPGGAWLFRLPFPESFEGEEETAETSEQRELACLHGEASLHEEGREGRGEGRGEGRSGEGS